MPNILRNSNYGVSPDSVRNKPYSKKESDAYRELHQKQIEVVDRVYYSKLNKIRMPRLKIVNNKSQISSLEQTEDFNFNPNQTKYANGSKNKSQNFDFKKLKNFLNKLNVYEGNKKQV